MGKKLGKLLLFTAAVGAAGAAAYYYLRKKDSDLSNWENDEDFDDFSEDLSEDADVERNYVPLPHENVNDEKPSEAETPAQDIPSETAAHTEDAQPRKKDSAKSQAPEEEDFTPLAEQVAQAAETAKETIEETVEEFFDAEDDTEEA